jgi:hypothetical protein
MKNDLKVTLGKIIALLEEQVLTQNVNYHINMQILAKCLCQPKQKKKFTSNWKISLTTFGRCILQSNSTSPMCPNFPSFI